MNDLGVSKKGDGEDSRPADNVVNEIRAKGESSSLYFISIFFIVIVLAMTSYEEMYINTIYSYIAISLAIPIAILTVYI